MSPAPIAQPDPRPTPHATVAFLVRDTVVTVISTASDSSSTSAVSSSSSTSKSLVAPIVGGLVGGIGAGILIAAIWFWCARRRRIKREEARVAYHRRRARKAANASGRPSVSSSAGHSSTTRLKQSTSEKEIAPPVPVMPNLPRKAFDPYKAEQGYGFQPQALGYSGNEQYYHQQQQQQHQQDSRQPYQAQQPYQGQSPRSGPGSSHLAGGVPPSAPDIIEAPIVSPVSPVRSDHGSDVPSPSKKASKSSKSAKSAARIAAAELAAVAATAPATERHRPNKPSPLALAGERDQASPPRWGDGPFRSPTSDEGHRTGGAQAGLQVPVFDSRITSGEWGVALGSPEHDRSDFRGTDSYTHSTPAADPYAAMSSQYSYDPYSTYKETATGNDAVDYHAAANSVGLASNSPTSAKKVNSGWI